MSDRITGKATYKCIKCGAKHFFQDEDFHFEVESSSERGMGREIQHSFESDYVCHRCDNRIHLRFDVWEYPVGVLNTTTEDASGAEILESDFEIYRSPPKDSLDKSANLIKSFLQFRFDAFAESFVDFWVSSYKKSPRPTTIMSIVAVFLGVLGLGLGIYSSESARKQRLERSQSYSEQFELLKSTEQNLNDLFEFISSKKNEVEATEHLINELEARKSELEPIVTANQEVVDAIFLQQRKEIERTIWTERGISFGLGILASLLATVIWHFVARFRKERRAKRI